MISNSDRFNATINAIDAANSEDPNVEVNDGETIARELLYSQRMSETLFQYDENPDEVLQLAARAQHIRRWSIPRNEYPMDRKGYLQWRTKLKLMHAQLVEEIMGNSGYQSEMIDKVKLLITKNKLKTDPISQQLEDVVCLVFLKYYFSVFHQKHDEAKIISILQKTWGKMTTKGREMAMKIDFDQTGADLIKKALS
ncbi:DUF4202 domain-containing protein [Fulvivirgaceae bacterium BMA12]|uniref:DUF4202 domain-containing protein n=1 Tax=Agaribacillus aureus TaxID=3051825 RepID=A0ABT8L884_9BACT|nr:DUF4202 domain-containing protein [Fulvivirgaceae bacterium BMA12]